MKKLSYIFSALILLIACSPEKMPEGNTITPTPTEVTPSITLGKSTLSFGANSSSETVTITSNVDWDFECSDSWVTASKGSFSQLNVSVTSNPSTSARSASISLKQQGKTDALATITVNQSGAEITNEIKADMAALSFVAGGGTENLLITANFAWETISKPSWITLSPSTGSNGSTSITVTASKSTDTAERTETIKIGKGADAVSIVVCQTADNIYTVNGVSFKMIGVEGGTFTMGSDAWNDEKPTHQVTLSSYSIGETEVTQELWEAVMGSNPSDPSYKSKKKPVHNVSWNECQEFIRKLNSRTGRSFRLPTEAEWEYAARGGKKSKGYMYAGSNIIDDVAWYKVNSYDTGIGSPYYGPQDVGGKAPNEIGLYDMSGNVFEWCYDWYGSYSSDAQTNPIGPSSGIYRVYRSNIWFGPASPSRVTSRPRIFFEPDYKDDLWYLGLRLAL